MQRQQSFSADVQTEERKRNLRYFSTSLHHWFLSSLCTQRKQRFAIVLMAVSVSFLAVWSLTGLGRRRSAQLSAPSRQSWVRCSTTWTKPRAGKRADPPTNRSATAQRRRSSGKTQRPRAKTGKQKRLSSPPPTWSPCLGALHLGLCVCVFVCVCSLRKGLLIPMHNCVFFGTIHIYCHLFILRWNVTLTWTVPNKTLCVCVMTRTSLTMETAATHPRLLFVYLLMIKTGSKHGHADISFSGQGW